MTKNTNNTKGANVSFKKEMEMFAFCVITFEPIITKTCEAPQNDSHSLSFVKNKQIYGEKIARKGHTKVIYRFSFISNWSLGAFPENERKKQIENWMKMATELGLSYSKDYTLQSTLGNQITIQSWYMNGLNRDDVSTDNGIILSTAERWVLMVDPQDIANRYD